MVCQLPNRAGNPRHLQPCSATYKMALSTCWFEWVTFAALHREVWRDAFVLSLREFHPWRLT